MKARTGQPKGLQFKDSQLGVGLKLGLLLGVGCYLIVGIWTLDAVVGDAA
jgi:hypothetical protein